MGDIDGGQSKLPADPADFLPHLQTQFRIQIGQWLIQEQAGRTHDEGPCQGDSLLLAAGHFVDFPPRQLLEPNSAKSFSHTKVNFCFRKPPFFQAERNILFNS